MYVGIFIQKSKKVKKRKNFKGTKT